MQRFLGEHGVTIADRIYRTHGTKALAKVSQYYATSRRSFIHALENMFNRSKPVNKMEMSWMELFPRNVMKSVFKQQGHADMYEQLIKQREGATETSLMEGNWGPIGAAIVSVVTVVVDVVVDVVEAVVDFVVTFFQCLGWPTPMISGGYGLKIPPGPAVVAMMVGLAVKIGSQSSLAAVLSGNPPSLSLSLQFSVVFGLVVGDAVVGGARTGAGITAAAEINHNSFILSISVGFTISAFWATHDPECGFGPKVLFAACIRTGGLVVTAGCCQWDVISGASACGDVAPPPEEGSVSVSGAVGTDAHPWETGGGNYNEAGTFNGKPKYENGVGDYIRFETGNDWAVNGLSPTGPKWVIGGLGHHRYGNTANTGSNANGPPATGWTPRSGFAQHEPAVSGAINVEELQEQQIVASGFELLAARGVCRRVTSMEQCEAAAAFLGLSDVTAEDDGQNGVSYDPPYCYFEGGRLKYNSNAQNTGICKSSDKCLCQAPPTVYIERPLVASEGPGLGGITPFGSMPACMEACTNNANCHSFAVCQHPNGGGCWHKNKWISPSDATTSSSYSLNTRGCKTWYEDALHFYDVVATNHHPRSSTGAASGCTNSFNGVGDPKRHCAALCQRDSTCKSFWVYAAAANRRRNGGRCCMKATYGTMSNARYVAGGWFYAKVNVPNGR